jgi:hypothetical protein
MLHHTNVDRLLAFWQAIHPDSFVPVSNSEDGTWVIPANSTIDETTGTPHRRRFYPPLCLT